MHQTAYNTSKLFFETYCSQGELNVVEIGSQNVNGTMRDNVTPNIKEYIGLDFAHGSGVDVVLQDPYKYPFQDEFCDVVVTSSCFEHSEMFWLSFLEGIRILKPHGLFYCNVPSSWMFYHRYPVDCWRFFPDAAKGLESWAKYNNYNSMVLESFVTNPKLGKDLFVADYIFVFIKDANWQSNYLNRMIDQLIPEKEFMNGFRFPKTEKYPNGWDKPIAQNPQDILENVG